MRRCLTREQKIIKTNIPNIKLLISFLVYFKNYYLFLTFLNSSEAYILSEILSFRNWHRGLWHPFTLCMKIIIKNYDIIISKKYVLISLELLYLNIFPNFLALLGYTDTVLRARTARCKLCAVNRDVYWPPSLPADIPDLAYPDSWIGDVW